MNNKQEHKHKAEEEEVVVVVGAGLSGALASILFAKRGEKVVAYDSRSDMRLHQIGGGRSINLAMSERGMKAMKQAGLDDEIKSISVPMRGRLVHPLGGEVNYQPYSPNSEQCLHSISRSLLNIKLMDIAEKHGVNLQFDYKCTGLDFGRDRHQHQHSSSSSSSSDADDDLVSVTFLNTKNQSTEKIKAKTVIGCDGAYSAIRTHMIKRDRHDYRQFYIEHGYKELHIPPSSPSQIIPGNDDSKWRLRKDCLHIWPRKSFMMIALPNIDGSFTCTLFFPFEGPLSFESLDTDDKVISFFKEQFPDVYEMMPDLMKDYNTNPTSSLITVQTYPWAEEGKVVLVGDAAHAIVPFYGQGMNAAFESTLFLFDCISRNDGQLKKAYKEYQTIRKKDADAIADLALQNFIEMRDSVADPDFVFNKKVEHALEDKFPGRYTSMYELVSFSTTPYSEAQLRGQINQKLLAELTKDADRDIAKIDFSFAEQLITKYYG
eukprot:TRINITY_DN1171_c0_g1_i3.p1 TRINITY_DN1171_c0_g1~~TRINITY_DN1171_c0_g1_i3.p1  ORF type:complete len:490 (+),score=138.09 TRINITY_DN1171_c0_g1_i3:45-1514(+)